MVAFKDISGQQFGRLAVQKRVGLSASRKTLWRCRCECGAEHITTGERLRSGRANACARCSRIRHGHTTLTTKSRTYTKWNSMIARCRNPNDPRWPGYGGRGITVCERWTDFVNFLADMGEAPAEMTLERKENSKGYGPDNCVWASKSAQNRNTRRTRLTLDAVIEATQRRAAGERYADLARQFGCHPATLRAACIGRTWREGRIT